MKLKSFLGITIATLFFISGFAVNGNAKTLKYRTTSSNSFSYTKYHQAFMYGGWEGKSTQLYTTKFAANADWDNFDKVYTEDQQNQIVDSFYGVFEDPAYSRTFYVRKVKGYPKIMQLKSGHKSWYVHQLDAKFYRYNTWRSGHTIHSLLPPTDKKHVMLKAHTHVYSSQPWEYNWAFKQHPSIETYYYSHGHWNWTGHIKNNW